MEFFYGDPERALVDAVHAGGALACWQVGSVEEAVAAAAPAAISSWPRARRPAATCADAIGLLPLLNAVLDAVDVPVVAAGGIGTARDMAAALAAGADAVRVGTRFVAATECGRPSGVRGGAHRRPGGGHGADRALLRDVADARTGCCARRSPRPKRR